MSKEGSTVSLDKPTAVGSTASLAEEKIASPAAAKNTAGDHELAPSSTALFENTYQLKPLKK